MAHYHISGIPVVETGSRHLVGILTNRDIQFTEPSDGERPITEFMTRRNLVTAPVGTTIEAAKEILQKHRIEKLPLVDEDNNLKGLITVKDIHKRLTIRMRLKTPRAACWWAPPWAWALTWKLACN
jgi:IMP dehydrogenase